MHFGHKVKTYSNGFLLFALRRIWQKLQTGQLVGQIGLISGCLDLQMKY